jgi:hypothetical protein
VSREHSQLGDVPGRERELEQLVGECRTAAERAGSGRVFFVAGGPSSGRGILLRALAAQLANTPHGPLVLTGRFDDGRYVPSDQEPTTGTRMLEILKRLGEAGEWIAGTLSDVGVPYAGIVEQVLERSSRPLELLEGLSARPEPPELARRVLTRLSRRGPVIWVVDDADRADGGGLWADLVVVHEEVVHPGLLGG